MNKISNAITGHHTTNTTGTDPATGTNYGAGAGGAGSYGTNHGAPNSGSAQVRDTSLNTTTGIHGRDHHLGRDVAAGAAGGAIGGVPGAALGAGASHLAHQHGTHSNLSSSTASSLGTSSMESSTGAGIGSGFGSTSTTTGFGSTHHRGASTTGSTDDAMTRSEEHLLVGKERVNAGSVGLNKYVTTERVGTEVPVMREKVVVEREPITDANRAAAMRGPDIKESHYEVNLTAEKAVAEKQTVPIERVRLRKEAEQSSQYVEADLRKEHIEVADAGKQLGAGAGLGGKQFGQQSTTGSRIGNEIQAERATHSSDRRL